MSTEPSYCGFLSLGGGAAPGRDRHPVDPRRPTSTPSRAGSAPTTSAPQELVRSLSGWNVRQQPTLPAELADAIADDVLDQFALAGTAEECAASPRDLQRTLPEVTGVRISAVPPLPHRLSNR